MHMQGYVTIKEASKLTNKHTDTIRRLIRANRGSKHIATDSKGRVILDSQWLISQYEPLTEPVTTINDQNDPTPEPVIQSQPDGLYKALEALEKQLEAKDQQLAEANQTIRELVQSNTKINDQFQQLLGGALLPANTTSSPQVNEDLEIIKEAPKQEPVKRPQAKQGTPKRKTTTVNKAKKTTKKTASKPKEQQAVPDKSKKVSWWRRI